MKILINIPDEKRTLLEEYITYCVNNSIIDGAVLDGKTREEVIRTLFQVEEINEYNTCSFIDFAGCPLDARFDKEWLKDEYEGW